MNPTEGLCYAVIFNQNDDGGGMSINGKIFITLSFPNRGKYFSKFGNFGYGIVIGI